MSFGVTFTKNLSPVCVASKAGLVQSARTLLGPAARDHDAEKLLLKTKLDKVPQSQILLHLTVLVGGMMGQFSIH
jgi:hypothetical protein